VRERDGMRVIDAFGRVVLCDVRVGPLFVCVMKTMNDR
jgi:hypothetical protein